MVSRIACAESKSRCRCASFSNTRPLYCRMPSKTPSPYKTPWSYTEILACEAGTRLPSIQILRSMKDLPRGLPHPLSTVDGECAEGYRNMRQHNDQYPIF